jgi:hypothetical protein
MLIPFLYATSPGTQSLRSVRVPSNQNIRWWLPFLFSLLKDKNFLSPHICQIDILMRIDDHHDTAHMRCYLSLVMYDAYLWSRVPLTNIKAIMTLIETNVKITLVMVLYFMIPHYIVIWLKVLYFIALFLT